MAETLCRHCDRTIVDEHGVWIDPEATGDDRIWRETCDDHDTFAADHEPHPPAEQHLTAKPSELVPSHASAQWIITGTSVPATPGQVAMALGAPIDDDHRGEWRWFRLAGGSLIFGFFPFETVYEAAINGPEPVGI